MSEHYDFHYQPTGSGAISGQQVLEQTEDAINELGDYVNDNVGGAMDVAQQALETAQNAEQDAQTALDTANSFSDAIQSAQQDASTALSTAQTAQTTASNANNTAIQAQQDANTAVTTANNASGQVSTLSGTVTALGQRVTTAEGNIGQNTSDITALTTRVGTAEGNITTLQNDVTIAQGNASSAMATAGQVKQQAFVFRYSSTALTPSSTNNNTLLDNTDNLKVGDKVIDSSGVLFSITAIDTENSTFTIGTALVDLAQDSDVVHKSGNETIGGNKTFSNSPNVVRQDVGTVGYNIKLGFKRGSEIATTNHSTFRVVDSDNEIISEICTENYADGKVAQILNVRNTNNDSNQIQSSILHLLDKTGEQDRIVPSRDNKTYLGTSTNRWSKIYGTEYYYGSNNIEFSSKFVTTDTDQTIGGVKSFSDNISTKKIISNVAQLQINARSSADSVAVIAGASASDGSGIWLYGKDNATGSDCRMQIYNTSKSRFERVDLIGSQFLPTPSGELDCGGTSNKWKTFNGLNPGCLSLPDFSNAIDISSYITVTGGSTTSNSYTPPNDGYISVNLGRSSGAIGLVISNGKIEACVRENSFPDNHRECGGFIPVQKNDTVTITSCLADSIIWAYFIPCRGNV